MSTRINISDLDALEVQAIFYKRKLDRMAEPSAAVQQEVDAMEDESDMDAEIRRAEGGATWDNPLPSLLASPPLLQRRQRIARKIEGQFGGVAPGRFDDAVGEGLMLSTQKIVLEQRLAQQVGARIATEVLLKKALGKYHRLRWECLAFTGVALSVGLIGGLLAGLWIGIRLGWWL